MSVEDNIRFVQESFLKTRKLIESCGIDGFSPDLKQPFVSIQFEAAAVALAVEDIQNEHFDFPKWQQFKQQFSEQHGSQIHVGLGWAIAEKDCFNMAIIDDLNTEDRWRIYDGMGYYCGLFKRRQVQRSGGLPEFIKPNHNDAFIQGFGRSFWYLSQGDPERLKSLMETFGFIDPKPIWRGVGLAMTYLGDISEEKSKSLLALSKEHLPSCKIGALLALSSCRKANDISASRSVFSFNDNLFKQVDSVPTNVDYKSVLLSIEEQL